MGQNEPLSLGFRSSPRIRGKFKFKHLTERANPIRQKGKSNLFAISNQLPNNTPCAIAKSILIYDLPTMGETF